jgi:hypothetical protein
MYGLVHKKTDASISQGPVINDASSDGRRDVIGNLDSRGGAGPFPWSFVVRAMNQNPARTEQITLRLSLREENAVFLAS